MLGIIIALLGIDNGTEYNSAYLINLSHLKTCNIYAMAKDVHNRPNRPTKNARREEIIIFLLIFKSKAASSKIRIRPETPSTFSSGLRVVSSSI